MLGLHKYGIRVKSIESITDCVTPSELDGQENLNEKRYSLELIDLTEFPKFLELNIEHMYQEGDQSPRFPYLIKFVKLIQKKCKFAIIMIIGRLYLHERVSWEENSKNEQDWVVSSIFKEYFRHVVNTYYRLSYLS